MGRKIRYNGVTALQSFTTIGDNELINMPARAMLHPYLRARIIFDRKFGRFVGHFVFRLPLNQPCRGRRVRVFDLDPIRRPPGPIRPIAALGDDAFEPHGAGVPEYRLAVGPFRCARTVGRR